MKYFSTLPSTTSRSTQDGSNTNRYNKQTRKTTKKEKTKQNKNTGEGVKQTNKGVKHFYMYIKYIKQC